jgi:hypothetical protein
MSVELALSTDRRAARSRRELITISGTGEPGGRPLIPISHPVRSAAVAALLLVTAGCRLPFSGGRLGAERRDLEAARARWAASHLGGYSYAVTPVCYCIRRAIRVTVQGAAVSRVWVDDGQPVPSAEEPELATVDAMLAAIRSAIAHDAASVQARYDERGVPYEVMIDSSANVADDESGWNVTDFAVATSLHQARFLRRTGHLPDPLSPPETPMPRKLVRVLVIGLTLFLPGCLVVTCGG